MSLVASMETNQLSQEMVQLPFIQLIGAQKAGTSAIADWLFEEGGSHHCCWLDLAANSNRHINS